jgi:plasmid stabilization system protein ParE
MNREVIWSSAAENDLADILEYLNFNWNALTVSAFLDTLDRNISYISSNPQQFPFYNRSENIRKCVVTKHNTLYYSENFSDIVLLRLYDVRQKPSKLKI